MKLFQKIVLFLAYFFVELVFEKIEVILADKKSFLMVEQQFPGQVWLLKHLCLSKN
jgi:hypothetical protein